MSPRPPIDLASQQSHMREEISAEEAAEERRLWADYYEATARALEIMRSEGTTTATLPRIAAEDARAAAAIERIKAIRGIDA
jgi:cytosine/adenosine deaminase-related metal-dependent hydrolase